MMTDRSSKVLADYLMCDDKIEDAAKLMRLYASHGYKKITACPLYCSETTVTEF